jgi:hypothetical protein
MTTKQKNRPENYSGLLKNIRTTTKQKLRRKKRRREILGWEKIGRQNYSTIRANGGITMERKK